jgi:RND family efflux transporter MFP subunit
MKAPIMKNRSISNAALTVLSTAAASLFLTGCSDKPAPQAAVRTVYVSTVAAADESDLRSFTASVRARVETELAFRTGGKIVQRLVDVGTQVRAGQALARLDTNDYALAVQAAEDQVRAARVDAEQSASDEARFRRLSAEGSVGMADHERQKARADAAAARLSQAQSQLALARNRDTYTTLVAPYDGVVTALRIEMGQVVAEGQPVLAVARDGEREIVADIPEEWVGRVRTAAASATGWDERDDTVLPLRLRELSPLASAQGRTFRARFAATEASRKMIDKLPLGGTAQLQLASKDSGKRGVQLPVTALVKGSGQPGVWVINTLGNGLVFKPVQVQTIDESSLLVSGLSTGEKVVTVGAQKLDAGQAVRAIERSQAQLTQATARSGS